MNYSPKSKFPLINHTAMKTEFAIKLNLTELELLFEVFESAIESGNISLKTQKDFQDLQANIKMQTKSPFNTLVLDEIQEKIMQGILSKQIKLLNSIMQDRQMITPEARKIYQTSTRKMSNLLNQLCHE